MPDADYAALADAIEQLGVTRPIMNGGPWLYNHRSTIVTALRLAADAKAASIDMILYCPKCGEQHIDAPDSASGWDNPPHKSHLCHACGTIWRPADVPTNGVARITSRVPRDTYDAPGTRESETKS